MTSMTLEATKELGVKPRDAERSKNFFALGLVSWMYTRPVEPTVEWIEEKFASREMVKSANLAAFKAGYNFGETAELFDHPYEIAPAKLTPGQVPQHHRQRGAVVRAARRLAGQRSCPSATPRTRSRPASDILHELSRHKNFGVRTLQAEDEIAAIGVAIGAAFAGQLGVTATSGPGVDLKSEALGLAISLELPLVLDRRAARRTVDRAAHQDRAGRPAARDVRTPRRGAAADRGGAVRRATASTPRSRRSRLALKYRTPVILLTDGYLANGAEPWLLPGPRRPARHLGRVRDRAQPHRRRRNPSSGRTCATPRRSRVRGPIPGTPGLDAPHRRHRESRTASGNINYDPENHEHMVHLRGREDRRHRTRHPRRRRSTTPTAPSCWCSDGGARGASRSRRSARRATAGCKVAHAHLAPPQPVPGEPR